MSKGFASNYRIVLLASGILVSFIGLGARLICLHVVDRGELMQYVIKARRQIIVEHARRGDILDVRGGVLATSRTLMEVGVDPQSLRAIDEAKWPQLAELLGLPVAELRKILTTKSKKVDPVKSAGTALLAAVGPSAVTPAPRPSAEDINGIFDLSRAMEKSPANSEKTEAAEDEVSLDEEPDANGLRLIRYAKLSPHVDESTYDKVMALGIKGVYGTRIYSRAYPHNQLASHVIGYVNKAGVPAAGIENYADFYLRGQNGWREGERDGKGREAAQFRTREVPASDGYSVTLSLDMMVQHIVEEELEFLAKKYQPQKATIIVSDPRTGHILALANYPTFNLSEYGKADPASMRNIAVADQYEPGSVFKIVAAAGALENGLVTPGTRFDCSIEKIEYRGSVRSLPGEDHHFDHPLTVAEIIARSSNRGAAQMGMLLGEKKFYEYVKAFGFGGRTGFPVGGEVGGTLAPPEKWDGLTITRMPMGHSVAVTPMQMHMGMSVVASGGLLLRPQIIREIRDASGEVVYRFGTVSKQRAFSERTAATMAKLLMGVASKDGTAPLAAIPGFEVAGKTGTTQKLVPTVDSKGRTVLRYSEKHHVASFVGFFPASRPQVAISVIVDDADAHAPGGIAYGSGIAAPSFKRIGEQLIQYLDIKPAYETPARGPGLLALEGGRR